MKKEIILTRILPFGGNNTYLKNLIHYFGKENVILILMNRDDEAYLSKIDPDKKIKVIYLPGLKDEVSDNNKGFGQKIKNVWYLLNIFRRMFTIIMKNGFAGLTISSIYPEKYIYFLWMPFAKVKYVLHSEPLTIAHQFTSFTCNSQLSNRKQIITVSSANKACIVKQWKIKEKRAAFLHVVYNCMYPAMKNNESVTIDQNRQIVLTMGHVASYKDPHTWLEVARAVVAQQPSVYFYWLGDGDLLSKFQTETAEDSNICFKGLIDHPMAYLKQATIYYQPSLVETQGISVLEAMSLKIPCIVSNVGGLPESINQNYNGFVVSPQNVKLHVDKMIELLNDQQLQHSFGENGYRRYMNEFDFESFRMRMNELYN